MEPYSVMFLALLKLASLLAGAIHLPEGFEKPLKTLKSRMETIYKVLEDAETKHFSDDLKKTWLTLVGKLEDIAYDAEDVADTIESRPGLLEGSFSNLFSRNPVLTTITDIVRRLDDISTEKDYCSMIESSGGKVSAYDPSRSMIIDRETTSGGTGIVGREDDVKLVANWLIDEDEASNGYSDMVVISIWGHAGVGKTAVAKKVFNDIEVKSQFGIFVWVCLRQNPSKTWLAAMILQQIRMDGSAVVIQERGLDTLYREIAESVHGKRLLLVMDDVWDLNWWEDLEGALRGCARIKILITTRDLHVSHKMKPRFCHHLDVLPERQSWSLFLREVLKTGESERDLAEVKDSGQKIVGRCKGLPLAIKAIARHLLSKKRTKEEWLQVLETKPFFCNQESGGIHKTVFPILVLSYNHLPVHLKPCFLFCSLYPKGFVFSKVDMVRLWMAEGFIQLDRESEREGREADLEIKGESYVEELASSCVVQVEERDSRERLLKFKLHDAFHDLALYVAPNKNARRLCLEQNSAVDQSAGTRQIAELVSFHGGNGETSLLSMRTRVEERLLKLRTFLTLDGCREIRLDSFRLLKHLRALDLKGTRISSLPKCIGDNLILLRYLRVSPQTEKLPKSIGKLSTLQTLDLSGSSITKLPAQIANLNRLRHLDLDETKHLMFLPVGIGRLTSLKTMNRFTVCGERERAFRTGAMIAELKELNGIRGSLTIEHIERLKTAAEAEEAHLHSKCRIKSLTLNLEDDRTPELGDDQTIYEIFEKMQPPPGVESLIVNGYFGNRFPRRWFCKSKLRELREIAFLGFPFLKRLPRLGSLTSLKSVHVVGAESVETVDTTLSFGSETGIGSEVSNIKSLTFQCMNSWTEWKMGREEEPLRSISELRLVACRDYWNFRRLLL